MKSVGSRHTGRIARYEASAGYGAVVVDGDLDATEWFFHCTDVADCRWHIKKGRAVSFNLVVGHCGQFEAFDIQLL